MKRFLLPLLLIATPAFAHDFKAGNITIAHPYSFPTIATARAAGGYLTLTNEGDTDDRLIAVKSPFDLATLHETVITNDVARMIGTDGVDIPAGASVALEPGGKHIMFMGLGGDQLEVGEAFTITLVFEKAGQVDVEVFVEARGTTDAAPEMDHSMHDMSDEATTEEGGDMKMDHSGHSDQ